MTPLEQLQSDAFERFAALQRRRWVDPAPAVARAADDAYAEFEQLLLADPADAPAAALVFERMSVGEASASDVVRKRDMPGGGGTELPAQPARSEQVVNDNSRRPRESAAAGA